MAALGLTPGQIALGTNIYSGLVALDPPPANPNGIVHQVASSTIFPTKVAGYIPQSVTGHLRFLSAEDAATFVADAGSAPLAERKFSYVFGTTEVYGYTQSGSISEMRPSGSRGNPTGKYEVSFSFPLTRSTIYRASDDSALYGS